MTAYFLAHNEMEAVEQYAKEKEMEKQRNKTRGR